MFGNITLASGREEMLAAIVRGLTLQSAISYDALAKLQTPARVVYEMGGAAVLRKQMHRHWAGKHLFRAIEGDSLQALVHLAQRATS
jgi:hypothetical protein